MIASSVWPWSPVWQAMLNGIGWVVAKIYELVPNYGLTIILLTVIIRVVLLPLGIKQIRSMQAMQVIQPKIKAIQQKYKGNRQKQQEETMKLYKEHGVNPLSGCWPMLLQFPILISMYSVLRQPSHPPHLPANSTLQFAINRQIPPPPRAPLAKPASPSGTDFLGTNLLCSALQAGRPAALTDRSTGKAYPVDCGTTVPARIPYYTLAVLMFVTTYFQQRQMQKGTPPGSSSQQQQALLKIMPVMFGVFGFTFPAGLVLYWTTFNIFLIGQQYFMLRARPESAGDGGNAAGDGGKRRPARKGLMAKLMERAEDERNRRDSLSKKRAAGPKAGGSKPGSKPETKANPGPPKKPGSGGSGGGNRKKRPKR